MDVVGLGILAALLVLFGFLTVSAFRARNALLKWAGGLLAGLLTVVFAAGLGLALYGYAKVNATYPNPVSDVRVDASPEQIRQAEKLARTCAGCHSSTGNLPLDGQNFAEGGPPIGTLWAPNLTQAHFEDWTDGEIIRAIREGVGKDGRSLIIMPSSAFRTLSDADVQALVAYLRAQPAVEPDTPPKQINVIGAMMVGALFPPEIFSRQEPITSPVIGPPPGPTAEYGNYLIHLGCQACHGGDYRGTTGADPNGPPPASDLVAFAKATSEADFVKTLRTGVKPDGTPMSDAMPWKDLEKLSDEDFRAIYLYLKTLG